MYSTQNTCYTIEYNLRAWCLVDQPVFVRIFWYNIECYERKEKIDSLPRKSRQHPKLTWIKPQAGILWYKWTWPHQQSCSALLECTYAPCVRLRRDQSSQPQPIVVRIDATKSCCFFYSHSRSSMDYQLTQIGGLREILLPFSSATITDSKRARCRQL